MMETIWRDAPLDVLVNNAAATFIARTEHLSTRAADAILAPTLHGALYCTRDTGRRWIEGGHKGVALSILSSTITGRAFTVLSALAKPALFESARLRCRRSAAMNRRAVGKTARCAVKKLTHQRHNKPARRTG
jgi:NAD(P)-dependent dehydrogenase (short-subunit alcohol dehydrogenase family)